MPIIDHFGILAPFYDRLNKRSKDEPLIHHAALPIEGLMLDAGGGTGRVARALNGLATKICVADLSLGMLREAGSNNGLLRVCSHTEKLPFPDEYFHRIIMVDALHHVCNYAETAREMWRVLKPGGRLVIEEPDVRTFTIKLVALAEKLAFMRSHFVSPPEIAELFNYQSAHTHVKVEGYNAWVIVEKD